MVEHCDYACTGWFKLGNELRHSQISAIDLRDPSAQYVAITLAASSISLDTARQVYKRSEEVV